MKLSFYSVKEDGVEYMLECQEQNCDLHIEAKNPEQLFRTISMHLTSADSDFHVIEVSVK
jgi:hypothetical protein